MPEEIGVILAEIGAILEGIGAIPVGIGVGPEGLKPTSSRIESILEEVGFNLL
jgi:hypothetical protein